MTTSQKESPSSDRTQQVTLSHLEVSIRDIPADWRYSVDHRLQPWIARTCGVAESDILCYTITHRSLDARRKPALKYVYRLKAVLTTDCRVRETPYVTVQTPEPDQEHPLYHLPTLPTLPRHPIVVGTGPAGMMAAYLFALYGCQPLVLERGFPVQQRGMAIDEFLRTCRLHSECNYLFGEGGAGTYSDGKLYTRVKDPRIRFILDAYVAARAPRRILYDHHPHIGSDILPLMIQRLRQRIEKMGATFRWGTTVQDIHVRNGRCEGVILADGDRLDAPLTVLACGHSDRHLIRSLIRHGVEHQAKNFQLGCRIEHSQQQIDLAQYGWIPPRNVVGAAAYTLVHRSAQTANTATFCMCPGGEILAATSDAGQLCTNGMSRFRRDGAYANAGLIVNQTAAQFTTALEALDFLTELERQAFLLGAGTRQQHPFRCPAQSARSFARGEKGLHSRKSSYHFGLTPARLDQLLPRHTVRALQTALPYFERLIPGFMRNGVLVGIESRVSSPVRFERHPETFHSTLPGLYVAGEGAGYAGGIISAALDGVRVAETILTGRPAKRKIA